MRSIIPLIFSLSLAAVSIAGAAEDSWKVVRPCVLVIGDDGPSTRSTAKDDGREEMLAAIRKAVDAVASSRPGVLSPAYDCIVVYERQDGWLIAFFRNFGGRMIRSQNGEDVVDAGFPTNPRVVVVETGPNGRVIDAPDLKAWTLPLMELGFETTYSDQTEEESFYNKPVGTKRTAGVEEGSAPPLK